MIAPFLLLLASLNAAPWGLTVHRFLHECQYGNCEPLSQQTPKRLLERFPTFAECERIRAHMEAAVTETEDAINTKLKTHYPARYLHVLSVFTCIPVEDTTGEYLE
jgi:hypothetical protein